jgi:hypothetical protein
VVGAAITAAVAALLPDPFATWVALVAAGLLAIAIVLRQVRRASRPERRWFDGRALAESVKTASWRFMMRAEPFDADDPQAREIVVRELKEMMGARPNLRLDPSSVGGHQITDEMSRVRQTRLDDRRSYYLANRVQDQIDWYARRASDHGRADVRWSVAGWLAEVIALLLALGRIVAPHSVNLVGALTAVAAGATAANQLQSHAELAVSYPLAHQELGLLSELIKWANDESGFIERVIEAENAISREHTMWAAKRR